MKQQSRFIIVVVFLLSIVLAVSIISVEADPELAYGGPGRLDTPLLTDKGTEVGMVAIWNTRAKLHIQIDMDDDGVDSDWTLSQVQIYVGDGDVPTRRGAPLYWEFPNIDVYSPAVDKHTLTLDLVDDLGLSWGEPYEDLRIQNIAIHTVVFGNSNGSRRFDEKEAWAFGPTSYDANCRTCWGWWFDYEMAHPKRGHFIDSPVSGLQFQSRTHEGVTGSDGAFDYFPGERVDLSIGSVFLGSPLAAHKISPLDIFENADTEDNRVINMARLLQSLDTDGKAQDGITITEDATACLDQTMLDLGLTEVDFANDLQIETVIQGTVDLCAAEGIALSNVSAEDAKEHLDKSLDSTMFRKNVSRTPDLSSSKSKLNIMGVWFPALKANGDPAMFTDANGGEIYGIPYYDENGDLIRVANEAKPIVVAYTDGVEETGLLPQPAPLNEREQEGREDSELQVLPGALVDC